MAILLNEIFGTAISLCAFSLLASAGYHKLNPVNRDYYIDVVRGYNFSLPLSASMVVFGIALVEVVAALLVSVPSTRSVGLVLGAFLMFFYGGVMTIVYWRGARDISCGCGGPGQESVISPLLFVRNLVLGLAFLLAVPAGLASSWETAGLGMLLALGLVLFYLSMEQLLQNDVKLKNIKQMRKL